VAFGKAAEILAKLISKGVRLFVSGKITYDKYKDKDGVERIGTKIVVQDFIVLTKGVNVNEENKPPVLEGGSGKIEEDELPF
jgi:single-stranded DNA-binding protein